jgi:altronate dehydratase
MKKVIINEKDNIGVCLDGNEKIPAGHKYALKNIQEGEYVIKYGEIIGRATQNIAEGDWVHTHNVKSHWMKMWHTGTSLALISLRKPRKPSKALSVQRGAQVFATKFTLFLRLAV